jgi:hypothetical protein
LRFDYLCALHKKSLSALILISARLYINTVSLRELKMSFRPSPKLVVPETHAPFDYPQQYIPVTASPAFYGSPYPLHTSSDFNGAYYQPYSTAAQFSGDGIPRTGTSFWSMLKEPKLSYLQNLPPTYWDKINWGNTANPYIQPALGVLGPAIALGGAWKSEQMLEKYAHNFMADH